MIVEARKLNNKGQCCGRRPIVYKRPPHLFCPRCDAAFDPESGRQKENWAYHYYDDAHFDARTSRAITPQGREASNS